ncbi:putative ABC transport system permease protein [Chitinophaga skermanii]|uniref:Putative ABC transport system permease protein n=1 Tax=Chitinophaga skermanii TaxID=331697 RepID=A0A327QIT8_9BACT|nr:FtsX-like permease family protein [Chitinophaga skermanii]RAJ03888.1 putative ABC transport system permease protein [Chitinophaga skermanii]
MLFNYIIVAWRNLRRNKLFSAINIMGLAIGLACCMALVLYIFNELSYDKQFKKGDQIYLLGTDFIRTSGDKESGVSSSAPFAYAMKSELPAIAQSTRLFRDPASDKILFRYTNQNNVQQSVFQQRGFYVDSTFFDVFDYKFIAGNPQNALQNPQGLVLSATLAKNLYSNPVNALGKVIEVESNMGKYSLTVTGVFDDSQLNHIGANFFMPMTMGWIAEFVRSNQVEFAANNMFMTYFRLHENATRESLEKLLPGFIEKYARKDLTVIGFDKRLFLIPLKEIHFSADIKSNILTPTITKKYLYILGSIAAFLLVIGCINFMNLATARSAKRAAEVGVRKSMGATKGALIKQFIGESMMITFIAFGIAVVLLICVLPLFNNLTGKQISVLQVLDWKILVSFLLLSLLTGVLAGSYPAFYLSMFKPVEVLKGKVVNNYSAIFLRKGLVVFQFIITICLILAALVIQMQMKYLQEAPLGFNKDQQIILPLQTEYTRSHINVIKEALRNNSQVEQVAGTQFYPGVTNFGDFALFNEGQTVKDAKKFSRNWVDENFLEGLGVKLLQGRLFSTQYKTDSLTSLVINEAGVRALGYKQGENVIGKKVYAEWHGEREQMEIVGVVKDFHFTSLHEKIEPFSFRFEPNSDGYNYCLIHVNTTDIQGFLRTLESTWNRIYPMEPFTYSMLSDDFNRYYSADQRTASIVNVFGTIAIVISCLGLFGLVAFSTQQRTKEIGIRKVLGASVTQIVTLLSRDFLKLVVLAIVIACPLAYWAMNTWLNDFAYKIKIEWWMYVVTAVVALLVAGLTLSYQSIKAALLNPVKSIKAE